MSLTKVSFSMLTGAPVNVLDYGAVGNGVADDTVAIQAAIDATPSGGCLYIPTNDYLISGTLTCNSAIHILGDGYSEGGGSRLVVKSTVNNTTDILVLNGAVGGSIEGCSVIDIAIVPQSGTPGRHGIVLGNNKNQNKCTIDRVKIGIFGSSGIVNSGAFSSIIQNSFISGIWFNLGTDNQNILNNTIYGPYWGVYINCVVGTNTMNICGNVIVTTLTGGIYAQNVGTLTIADNQFETQGVSTSPESSMIILDGVDWYIYNTQITGNNFNISPGQMVRAIWCKKTINVSIYGNSFSGGLPFPVSEIIKTNNTSINTIIGQNFVFNSQVGLSQYNASQQLQRVYNATYYPEGRILDAGYSTCGVWKLIDYSAFPDTTRNANYNELALKKTLSQQIVLSGGVNLANVSSGKAIFTIPTGFGANAAYNTYPVTCRDSSNNYYTASVRIDGFNVYLAAYPAGMPSTVEVSFEGVSYQYYF